MTPRRRLIDPAVAYAPTAAVALPAATGVRLVEQATSGDLDRVG